MSELESYGILLGLVMATTGLVLCLTRVAGRYVITDEPAKKVPFDAGVVRRAPAWHRYHVRYYGLALLFLAFDMEMAFMYPWAVVYRELGVMALADMGVFLLILFLGLLYGWREGALERQ